MVQKTARELLHELSVDSDNMGRLPATGVSVYTLLAQAVAENQSTTDDVDSINPMILILSRVPEADLLALQEGVKVASAYYRYYHYRFNDQHRIHDMGVTISDLFFSSSDALQGRKSNNSSSSGHDINLQPVPKSSKSIDDLPIPTSIHLMPDGGAIDILAQVLSLRKKRGIAQVHKSCQAERIKPGHKYVGNYPCEHTPKPPKGGMKGQKRGAKSTPKGRGTKSRYLLESRRLSFVNTNSSIVVSKDFSSFSGLWSFETDPLYYSSSADVDNVLLDTGKNRCIRCLLNSNDPNC